MNKNVIINLLFSFMIIPLSGIALYTCYAATLHVGKFHALNVCCFLAISELIYHQLGLGHLTKI